MKNVIKPVLLFSVLVVPALVFVFLKQFGENQYDIPVFHRYGMNDSGKCDRLDLHGSEAFAVGLGNIVVFSFLTNEPTENSDVKLNNLSRIVNYFNSQEIVVLSVSSGEDSVLSPTLLTGSRSGNWKYVKAVSGLDYILECGLALPNDDASLDKFVLMDKENRIRGYYDAYDTEDVDRLMVELRILLDNYRKDGENNN